MLSKSTFIRGLQCDKSLYLYKHHYKLKDPTPPSIQTVFEQGNNIGLIAQEIFPNGVDASPENHFKMFESIRKTLDYIESGQKIIYEATFSYNNVIAALDILVKDKEGWKAYEVKSSTKISNTYIKDAAIQYYTIINSGIDLKDISIVYINNQYTKEGDLDIHQLFKIESVYDQVLEFLPRIPNEVNRLQNVIKSPEVPKIVIGPHCSDPYDCDFKGTCWRHVPEYSVFDIANLGVNKKFDFYNKGVITIDQIDLNGSSLSSNQVLQIQSEINGTTHIDVEKIRNFTNGLNYPLYFLDFETIRSALPIYDGTRPFQQLVFQYSLHIKKSPSSPIEHCEYLADPYQDPRIEFINQLIEDSKTSGDIIVYNITFEKNRIIDLIDAFPIYTNELKGIVDRLKDLMIPFQKKWYYSPEMKGKHSLKNILPSLFPEDSYDDLEIKDGGTASNTFLSIVNGTFEGDIEEKRRQLLDYCEKDTLAMVKILDKLLEI